MGNVQTHRDAHDAFNRRDYDEMVRAFRADASYVDHPRGMSVKGPHEFSDWTQGWVRTFSDANLRNPRYIDGGDHTVALFEGTGTNDGPLGTLPPTNKRINVPFCEVMRYDEDGRIVAGEIYYDNVTIMVQLGHMQPLQSG
ncbi:nuclear transport factor 2 family protein [Actinomycetes bacterium KLBMP 9797]